ncbi:hypothetical protein AGABI1DRAFT_114147 [Agaricus bisporus var. burnettii JB137-S8]|uniref:Uncharacterized protein n=1 Tax=Agaricus bisporus var. burnettii (strain JB137-S8 / ATCC MYA-4627 / FGSC 10392) TaxID=597362 RepID=K5X9H3_AGABU|nr:uncharacterized protein AGABI1DRAFT_114147 [Agaricus bisporus var. burnettii JB137-S8]EKM79652.1 hypothetical protein AGABI1DRAFT_114147 [Agaricus bisporus var. burnettii JB137-S8]
MEANSATTSPADSAPTDQREVPNPLLSFPSFFSQQIPSSFQLPAQSNQPLFSLPHLTNLAIPSFTPEAQHGSGPHYLNLSQEQTDPQGQQTDPQGQPMDLFLQQFQSQSHKIHELLQVVMITMQRQQQMTDIVVNTLVQRNNLLSNYLLSEVPILRGRSQADIYCWLEGLENYPQSHEPSHSRSE